MNFFASVKDYAYNKRSYDSPFSSHRTMSLPLVPHSKIAPACRCLLLREPLCSPSIPSPTHLHIRGEQIREFRTARVNRFRTEMAHLRAFDSLLLLSVKVMHCFGGWICFRFHVKYKNFEIRYFVVPCIQLTSLSSPGL